MQAVPTSVAPIPMTAFAMAQRFVGVSEVPGSEANPMVLSMLRLDQTWPGSDDVPWCSAFVNYVAWLLRLPRSKNLSARSWLGVGVPVAPHEAEVGFDVCVYKRGNNSPGPDVLNAPGHVGFFAGRDGLMTLCLGGNQGDRVSVIRQPVESLLGIRRLA